MQSLIAIAAVLVIVYAVHLARRSGYNFISFMRICVKRLVLYIMSFSCIVVFATVLMLACYSNISELLNEVLSINSVNSIKSLIRLVFGVDSAFVALQMLAIYSLMASFISCLLFSVGLTIRFVYRTFLSYGLTVLTKKEQDCDSSVQHVKPSFKLYLKYNS